MRITPAHAGKSYVFHVGNFCRWDHPRTRGEKKHMRLKFHPTLGSPPHTRGKVAVSAAVFCFSGITPAHAGKRMMHDIGRDMLKDHPRTRGEKMVLSRELYAVEGSPPHTRGKDNDMGQK